MPVHNWKGIEDGIFHDLHGAWIQQIRKALNSGLLPRGFEAKSEQRSAQIIPDVLTLEMNPLKGRKAIDELSGGTAVLAPPKAVLKTSLDMLSYANRQNRIVIQHASGKKVVGVFEIVSRGNKSGRGNLNEFIAKAWSCLQQGIHFSYVDVHPPGLLDPCGIHGEICFESGHEPPKLPRTKKLCAAGYEATETITAFVNPFGVGDLIPETPLFLRRGFHVMLPLEQTYNEAFTYFGEESKEIVEHNTHASSR
ncbi:MAG TPA: hypothetical protein VKX17_05445 [Planctomycetota bacterium]|nr:hypothetical protein [Planctomycetota bacterium]